MNNRYSIITSDGREFQLISKDEGINFTKRNTAFQFEKIEGEYSQDLEFPVRGNEHIIKGDHHISTIGHSKVYNARHYYQGQLEHEGLFSREDSSDGVEGGKFKMVFIIGSFAYKAKDLTLQDVCGRIVNLRPNGVDSLLEAVKYYNSLNYPASPIVFPVKRNDSFYGQEHEPFQGTLNPFDAINEEYLEMYEVDESGPVDVYNTIHTYVPDVYLLEVLEEIARYFQYRVQGTFINDSVNKRWTVEGALAMDKASGLDLMSISKIGYPWNPINEDNAASFYIDFNVVNPENTVGNVDVNSDNPYTIVDETPKYVSLTVDMQRIITEDNPFLSTIDLKFHIKTNGTTGLGQEFDYSMTNNGNNGQILTETFDFILSPTVGDIGETIGVYVEVVDTSFFVAMTLQNCTLRISNTAEATKNVGLEAFRLGNTLPPVSVNKFLLAVKNSFCTTLDIDSAARTITMNYSHAAMLNQPNRIPDKRVVFDFQKVPPELTKYKLTHEKEQDDTLSNFMGEVSAANHLPGVDLYTTAFAENENAYYRYIFNSDNNSQEWSRLESRFKSITLGEGEEKVISTGLQPPDMKVSKIGGEDFVSAEYLMPVQDHKGASKLYGMPSLPKHDLSFLFFAGYNPASQNQYPLSTTTHLNYEGEIAHSQIRSILITGEYGLYEKYWKAFLNIVANAEIIKIPVVLTRKELRTVLSKSPWVIQNQILARVEQPTKYAHPDEEVTIEFKRLFVDQY